MSLKSSIQVAGELVCYCTSCKLDLYHVVVAMHGSEIAKVQCLTCKKFHQYRPSKGTSTNPKAPSSSAPKKTSASSLPHEEIYLEAMRQAKGLALTYSPSQTFQKGEKIKHPQFGEGVVQKLLFPNKVEVLFLLGIKTLVHTKKGT